MHNRTLLPIVLILLIGQVLMAEDAHKPEGPQIVWGAFLGTQADDRLDASAYDETGRLIVVGTFGKPHTGEGFSKHIALGAPDADSTYGSAFIAIYSPDGKPLRLLQLSQGLATFTDVAVNTRGIYVAGYATARAERLLAGVKPFINHAGARPDLQTVTPKEHYDEPKFAPGADQRGRPIVLRFDNDLTQITAGTFLEGWQSVWHVPEPLNEDWRQPTTIGLLSDGRVAVGHDGGYNRPAPPDRQAGPEEFYYVPDYLSLLSANLDQRQWKLDLYLPATDKPIISQAMKMDWQHETLGNPRLLRLRTTPDDQILIAGWSAAHTSKEPWWASFLRKYDADGKLLWSAYEPSPTGGDGRMNGLVSDSCIRSVNIAQDGNLLVAAMSDGGNTILRRDPRDFTKETDVKIRGHLAMMNGRTLFAGMVAIVGHQDPALLVGDTLGGLANKAPKKGMAYTPAWANDIASVGNQIIVAGRCGLNFPVSTDAWLKPPSQPYTRSADYGMIRYYDPELKVQWSTALVASDPKQISTHQSQAAIVGTTASRDFPSPDRAFKNPAGATDGFILVLSRK